MKHEDFYAWLRKNEPKPQDGQITTFLQWKNTDVCLDFVCTCGHMRHLGGFFVYYIRCPECQTVWVMSQHVIATKLEGAQLAHVESVLATVIQ